MGELINCKAIAQKIKDEVKAEVGTLNGVPHLAVIIVEGDKASEVYVRNKHKVCEEVGIKSSIIKMPGNITQDDLEWTIKKLNADKDVHGILLQLPLPKHLDEAKAIDLIKHYKDVDGLTTHNMGLLLQGRIDEAVVPCTPSGVMRIFKELDYDLTGKDVVVIGRSNLFGKPMAQLLTNANATVTLCHSKTYDLKNCTGFADVTICAIGRPKYLDQSYFSFGDIAIDVGINRTEDGLCGDIDTDSVISRFDYVTPVPGGVGVLTTATLMKNVLKCYHMQEGK